jgi:hypothetical protein
LAHRFELSEDDSFPDLYRQWTRGVDGRWRFVFTANSVSIRNGAGAEIVTYAAAVPPTGWVILGVHNHASMKYENKPSVVGLFDNVTYPR